jgi:transcriptional regulator GlxA family with amidase domain
MQGPRPPFGRRLVETCLELAQAPGGEKLRVNDLCVKLGVSVRKLQNAFSEAFGVPPGRYIRPGKLVVSQYLIP